MKQWWQGLNGREQRLVIIMASIVMVFVFITAVWQPLNSNLAKAQKNIEKQQKLSAWMQENLNTYKQLKRSGGSNAARGSLTSIMNNTAKRLNITIARMQPQGDDLQVWIDQVPFNDLLSLLEQLTTQQGLKVMAIDIALADTEGTVKVRRLQVTKA